MNKRGIQNKKGELTTKQLVTLIILIASFIIILFLIFRLNLGQTTDEEICRNSVVLKGQSQLVSGPLDCKTDYVTISTEKEEEVMKIIADEMASCWYMFGEGEVDYGKGLLATNVRCAICSVIEFDEKTRGKFPQISYSRFYNYLKDTKKDESLTYLQYLYGVDSVSGVADGTYFNFNLANSIDTTKKQSILTGVDMNPEILFIGNDDRYLNTFIVQTGQTSQTKCNEFITKA